MPKKKKKKTRIGIPHMNVVVGAVTAVFVIIILIIFAIPFPYKVMESQKVREPFEEERSFVEKEPFTVNETYYEIINEDECNIDLECKCNEYRLNMTTYVFDICVKCSCTRVRESIEYKDVTKTRTVTRYREYTRDVAVTKYSTLFRQWTK